MKLIFVVISFIYINNLYCQLRIPKSINYKDKGTYLISVSKGLAQKDSALIYVRMFGISKIGCKTIGKGTVILRDRKVELIDSNKFRNDWFFAVEPGKFEITLKTPYSFYVPLTTKKLKFYKGYHYHITFFLLTDFGPQD